MTRPPVARSFSRACALSLQRSSMADPEVLGFEHMGLDPRLLQVPGGLRSRRAWGWGGGHLSLPSSLLGRRRPGLVAAHADPGKGHPTGPGGEGPPGPGPHWLGENGRLCHSDVAAAAPQEDGGSREGPQSPGRGMQASECPSCTLGRPICRRPAPSLSQGPRFLLFVTCEGRPQRTWCCRGSRSRLEFRLPGS